MAAMPLPEIKPLIMVQRAGATGMFRRSGRSLWQDQAPEEDVAVVVYDVESYESFASALAEARASHPKLGGEVIVLAAVGARGEDLSGAAGVFAGIVQRPAADTFEAWFKAVEALVIGIKFPDYKDTLDPKEIRGAVSSEEFLASMRAALTPDKERKD
jgi:hypothetical protein